MRWITPHFLCLSASGRLIVFVLQVKFVDDSVRQADNRNMDIRYPIILAMVRKISPAGMITSGAVGFHAELFHTFFQRKRFQACVQLL